jgi:hypothetical protein
MTEKLTPEEKATRKAARRAAVTSRRTNAAERDRSFFTSLRFNKRSTTGSIENSLEDSAMTPNEYQVASGRRLTGPESDAYRYADRAKGDRTDAVPEEPRIDGPDSYQLSNRQIIDQARGYWLQAFEREKIDADAWEEFKVDEAEKDQAEWEQMFRAPDPFEPFWSYDPFNPFDPFAGQLFDNDGQPIDDRPEWDQRPLNNGGQPIDDSPEWDH